MTYPLTSWAIAESDEEAARTDVPITACHRPLQWSACNKEKLAHLVALYADLPEDNQVEEETHARMDNKSLNQYTVASASHLPKD